MRDEGSAVFAGRVAESTRRRIPTVDQDYAFEARGHGRENAAVSGHFRLATANDAHVPSVDVALETLARPLTHLARIEQRETSRLAASRIGAASGCFEYRSTLAANCSTSGPSTPSAVIRSVKVGWPYVSAPVLSRTTVRQPSIRSRTAGSRMMMLRFAASEMAPMIVTGMAMSSGQGVATTSTARNRTGSPLHIQADGQHSAMCTRHRADRRDDAAADAAVPSRA